MDKILQKPAHWVPAKILNEYIKVNGAAQEIVEQNIPAYYIAYGEKFGVDWLVAFAQACHETGFFTFKGGVKREHNNFAGLGATVAGKPGDVYKSVEDGVKAHLMHLCWYADKVFPIDEYPDEIDGRPNRTQDNIKAINRYGYGLPTWKQLSYAYAADGSYLEKLEEHYNRLLKYCLPRIEKHEDKSPTWLEFNRTYDGLPWVTGYAGDKPVVELAKEKRVDVLIEFLQKFYKAGAKTFLVADTKKAIQKISEEVSEESKESKKMLSGKKILVSAGHSSRDPGAIGKAPDYPKERDLNVIQTRIIVEELEKLGAEVLYIEDKYPHGLSWVGSQAKDFDMLLEAHHNSAGIDSDKYTCVMVDNDKHDANDKKAATLIAKEVSKSLGIPTLKLVKEEGVYPLGLTVLDTAKSVGCKCAILTESYFVNVYGYFETCRERSTKAAYAIVEGIKKYFS